MILPKNLPMVLRAVRTAMRSGMSLRRIADVLHLSVEELDLMLWRHLGRKASA